MNKVIISNEEYEELKSSNENVIVFAHYDETIDKWFVTYI